MLFCYLVKLLTKVQIKLMLFSRNQSFWSNIKGNSRQLNFFCFSLVVLSSERPEHFEHAEHGTRHSPRVRTSQLFDGAGLLRRS